MKSFYIARAHNAFWYWSAWIPMYAATTLIAYPVFSMNNNFGLDIADALNWAPEGMQKAYVEGLEWLLSWFMDEVPKDAAGKLLLDKSTTTIALSLFASELCEPVRTPLAWMFMFKHYKRNAFDDLWMKKVQSKLCRYAWFRDSVEPKLIRQGVLDRRPEAAAEDGVGPAASGGAGADTPAGGSAAPGTGSSKP